MTSRQFWARKQQELAFLGQWADGAETPSLPDTTRDFNEAVATLRERLFISQAKKASTLWETAPTGHSEVPGSLGTMSYTYQRYDLQSASTDWLRDLYACQPDMADAEGLLFSCGMSAIGATAAVLARRELSTIAITPIAYFETHLLFRRFFSDVELTESNADADVLWVDTSSTTWRVELQEFSTSPKLLVIDTSCVDAVEDEVRTWLDRGRAWKCPVVLLRSHLKLDTFGLELGRLGSALVICEHDQTAGEELSLELKQARSGFGTNFSTACVYPWLGSSEFAALATQRGDGIRSSTTEIAEALSPIVDQFDGCEIIETDHDLFFLIRTGLPLDNDSAEVRDSVISNTLGAACEAAALPAVSASSFGLDRVTVIDFVNMHDDAHYIRISGADLPPGVSRDIGNAMGPALQGLLAK